MADCIKCGARIRANEIRTTDGRIREVCMMCEWIYNMSKDRNSDGRNQNQRGEK